MLSIFKKKPGRPVSINKSRITKKCLDFYINNGIDNKSFNEVIKSAGVSKGSIYRLYGSEDSLQKTVLDEYFHNNMKEKLNYMSETTVKEFIMEVASSLITNKAKPCIFWRSRIEKYKLGPNTKRYLTQIEDKVKLSTIDLIKRDFKRKKVKISNENVMELANFLINNLNTLHLLKLNNAPHKLILSFSKTMLKQFR